MNADGLASLPDPLWVDAARSLDGLVERGDLILAPVEFLHVFPGSVALHVRRRMLGATPISHYILHKGMLDRVDPEFVREAMQATPVFANAVFVVYSRRGGSLTDDQSEHLAVLNTYSAQIAQTSAPSFATGVVVTTYNRPWALRRTLASLSRQGRPIVVVDDGSPTISRFRNGIMAGAQRAAYMPHPDNLGLAHSLNVGVCHWLAHPEVEWISTFNDDVEVVDGMFDVLENIVRHSPHPPAHSLYTGYADDDHPRSVAEPLAGRAAALARSCPAKHLHAHRSYWQSVLPIPTAYTGAPKPAGGLFPGHGSDADWWVGSWAPQSAPKQGGSVVVIPGLVSTFATGASSSTWGNKG